MNQEKINYDKKMMEILTNLEDKPNILLHSCCGPCSSACIERLSEFANITVLYYNPNIEPKEEYLKRKETQIKLLNILNIPYMECEYDNEDFQELVKNNTNDLEGGARCSLCFTKRLTYTAKKAKENNFDYFATTLTVSPHKSSQVINELGESISKKENIKYLYADFKKREGYKRSIELSSKYNLYRQDYCGCIYSKRSTDMNKKNGFTLVELLAVISILGVVLILFLPSMMNLYNKSKKNMRELNEKSIIDAGKMYAVDLDSANIYYQAESDISINGNNYKRGDKLSTYDLRVLLIEKGLDVPITFLVKNGYYNDTPCNYDDKKPNCKVNKECIVHISIEGEKIVNNMYYQTKDYKASLSDKCK